MRQSALSLAASSVLFKQGYSTVQHVLLVVFAVGGEQRRSAGWLAC
jgi:hypothetical protein